MGQNRHVLSISLDDELLDDIDYSCNTAGDEINRSKEIEKLLRAIIPSRRLSILVHH